MQNEPYILLREARKTVRLTVETDGKIVVRAPKRTSSVFLDAFVAEKRGWIEKRRAEIRALPKPDYETGGHFLLLGREIMLQRHASARHAALEGDVLTVPAEPAEETRTRVLRFYQDTARQVFRTRLDRYASAIGVTCGPFRLSSAVTRWGSCGKNNSINLNYRLVRAPMEIVDYVIVHELCHCKEHNHSRRFWAEVAAAMPDYAARRAWLKQNGASLLCD